MIEVLGWLMLALFALPFGVVLLYFLALGLFILFKAIVP